MKFILSSLFLISIVTKNYWIDLALQCVEERLNDPNLPENLKPITSNELNHILME